ncbi:DUF881 domain-containing protein [Kineococcus terrestris]|uniref:DUF881 domain-containing protein n=1 Tax=Kineococcus terrestris TaxID=2044856 RepID=UPI0034DB2A2C
MSLITELVQRPLDPGYAEAARRRGGAARPAAGRAATLLALALVGAVLAVAAVRADERAPAADRGRQELLARVEAGTARADELAGRAAQLRAGNARLQERLGGAAASAAAARADELAVAAGAVAVTGPGVRVVLSDAPPDATTGTGERVVDRDLQVVVNGLWLAGAEAVAVDGVRLTSLSSIRAAGEAVLVDYRPLTPPYAVEAVGGDLQTGLATTVAGRYLQALRDNYGLGAEVEAVDELLLPAAGRLDLRVASAP